MVMLCSVNEAKSLIIQRALRGKVVNLAASKASTIDFMLRDQKRLWNWQHFNDIKLYNETGKFIFYKESAAALTKERQNGVFGAGCIATQQQCLMTYDRALKNSFSKSKNRRGFPKLKKNSQDCSLRFPAIAVRKVIEDGFITHVRLPKLGLLRVRNLKIPTRAKINSFTLKKDACGYWISVQFAIIIDPPVNDNQQIVGLDAGLSVYMTLSSGEQIQALKPLRKAQKKLRTAQRRLARRKKGSINRKRAAKSVAVIHSKVKHCRRNAQHQLSRRLLNENGLIALETLSLSGLKRLKHQGFAWSDIGLGELYRLIRYKANWAGVEIYEHPRFARSTGCCPDCRHIGERLDLKIRNWTCTKCGNKHDRDIAAAKWLQLCAIENRKKVGAVSPEPVRPAKAQSPKRGRLHTAMQPIAGMRSEPYGEPIHDGSPANIPSDVMCIAHALAG